MNDILVHLPNETEDQCLWRVGKAKDAGTLTENWPEIALFFNKTFRDDETQYYDPSAYRKKYRNFVTAYESIFSHENFTISQMAEYEDQKKEMFKIKKQWQDQRRECVKLWTEESRFEHIVSQLVESANHLCEIKPLNFSNYILEYDNAEAVICWADWHYGMVTDNIWNQYNTEICKQRVTEFVDKAISRMARHKVKRLHIMLL